LKRSACISEYRPRIKIYPAETFRMKEYCHHEQESE